MSTREQTPQELRREIDATLRELGGTVEQLAHKTALRARLRDRVWDFSDELKRVADRPAVQWTTVPPAKSSTPSVAIHPPSAQTQCATGL